MLVFWLLLLKVQVCDLNFGAAFALSFKDIWACDFTGFQRMDKHKTENRHLEVPRASVRAGCHYKCPGPQCPLLQTWHSFDYGGIGVGGSSAWHV